MHRSEKSSDRLCHGSPHLTKVVRTRHRSRRPYPTLRLLPAEQIPFSHMEKWLSEHSISTTDVGRCRVPCEISRGPLRYFYLTPRIVAGVLRHFLPSLGVSSASAARRWLRTTSSRTSIGGRGQILCGIIRGPLRYSHLRPRSCDSSSLCW